MTTRHAQPDDWGAVTHRLATLVSSSSRQHAQIVERLAQVVGELNATGLVVVVGEQHLLERLRELDERATQVVQQLGTAAPGEIRTLLDQLDVTLADDRWALGAAATKRLESQRPEVLQEREEIGERYKRWSLDLKRCRAALDDADRRGVVSPDKAMQLRTMEDLLEQAHESTNAGDFGGVANRLARLEKIAGSGVEQFLDELRKAREDIGLISELAELVVVKNEEPENVIEYTLMLKRPGASGQSVNLQSASFVVVQDREALRSVVGGVTQVVQMGVREARSGKTPMDPRSQAAAAGPLEVTARVGTTAPSTALPAPEPVTGVPPEPVRGFPQATDRPDHVDKLRRAGSLLYHLVFPDLIQRLLHDERTSIVVTTNDLEMPWELLHDGSDFLCLQRPIGRLPLGYTYPRLGRANAVTNEGWKLRVLLVGSDSEGNLPGVVREIGHITDSLKGAWGESVDIVSLIGAKATGEALNEQLQSGAFHIIHFAGHAIYDKMNPERSRLMLHNREVFFAQKIQRILEGNPLVFINACESSTTANDDNKTASAYFVEESQGLASAFIYGGAPACVGSIWPVFDDTAAEMAAQFYGRLLEGYMVGEALRLARLEVRQRPGDQLTWAAYALYGDPRYRLPLRPTSREEQRMQTA